MRIKALYISVAMLLMWGCVSDNAYEVNLEVEYFKTADVVGYYGAYGAELALDSSSEQIYQREEGRELRIIDDEGMVLLTFVFDEIPSAESEDITLTVTTADSDEETILLVSSVNSSDERLWLWDSSVTMGVVVPVW